MKFSLSSLLAGAALLLATASAQTDFSAQNTYYTIESQTQEGMTLLFEFPEPVVESVSSQQPTLKRFSFPGMVQNNLPGLPQLPVLSVPLMVPGDRTDIRITPLETQAYPGFQVILFDDKVAGEVPENSLIANRAVLVEPEPEAAAMTFPEKICQVEALGQFRDYMLHTLIVYPLLNRPDGQTFFKKFRVQITYPNAGATLNSVPAEEADLLQKLVINDRQMNRVNPLQPQLKFANLEKSSAFQGTARVRLIVDSDDIYQVRGADLEEAGINLSDIDPRTLRLENRGLEVAFFLIGDRDGEFNAEDYLEFWGEPNQRTLIDQYPDVYSDPFTDENVYWLSWGGDPGARMVEESGSITTDTPGEFNPSFFFTSTQHFEENRRFERQGASYQEKLSYQRDQWFFDSGIKAVGKQQYEFELIHPDESSFNPVTVSVMMAGKSFGAAFNDVPIAHDVQVWLNNGFVGSAPGNWFDQDTARIANVGNSTIRTNNLNHGTNTLEVQLPTLPDITQIVRGPNGEIRTIVVKGTDIVLLNWFDVTYDRKYLAHQNRIDFRRPSFIPFPRVDLFQFDLENFVRSDISIYKKGVSKIINFRIRDEVIRDTTFYTISFQDNVTTDQVEYVAISENQKKRPKRIEVDLPFDLQNPSRLLRDRSNAAEYLIITHKEFYNDAIALAEHRRSQGLTVEMVTVQDIYDEFNSGIKSPLAIQDFLRYAFFNWSRQNRLKYVVFLGDANFNYRINSGVNQDYVPTFMIQTQDFGASATDFPYTLIAGDDDIPDIFLGRIPVSTKSDVSNVVNKIIEYDTFAEISAWRNQALFISGNDSSTYELFSSNPAFRTQNSRIIESILPNHLSASRLNTVRNRSLPIDPNFGSSIDLLDYWNDGLFWVNFMGHGGGGIWADVKLMGITDVDRLTNQGRYPFVTSMTCFTGAFENPSQLGLAQKLLLVPDKGAIGILASSGLGYLHNDYTMLWNIGQYMFDGQSRMGEKVTLGKIRYQSPAGRRYVGNLTTPGYNDVRKEMLYQYNLIGDPYTRMKYAPEGLSLEVSNPNPQLGEDISVTINSSLAFADGYLDLVDNQFNLVRQIPLFGVSGSQTVNVPIPNDFSEGTGIIRAYLNDGSSDAAGNVRIGVNYAALQELTVDPAIPGVGDTVTVSMRLFDRVGINKVYMFVNNAFDTTFATRGAVDTSLFSARIDPADSLTTVIYDLYVENNLGNRSAFPNQSYVVRDIRPDITIKRNSLSFTGTRRTEIKAIVENNAGAGGDGSLKVDVRFFDGEQNFLARNSFSETSITLGELDTLVVRAPFSLPLNRASYQIFAEAIVDPTEDVADFNLTNNVATSVLSPSVFTISPAANDTVRLGDRVRVFFPQGTLSDSAAVRIQLAETPIPQDQSGLEPIPLVTEGQLHALNIDILNPDAFLTNEVEVWIRLDTTLLDLSEVDLNEIKLYQKRSPQRPWSAVESSFNAQTREIYLLQSAEAQIAPFLNDDVTPPLIELTADGRPLRESGSGLVAQNPSLYLIIEDESGINLDPENLTIRLNGAALPDDKIFVPDSLQRNNSLGITLFPELQNGTYQLEVEGEDVNGNKALGVFQLVVSDEFDLRVYGNYPNPFKDQTIFSYFVNLNDDLDEFEIRIYTVSGRLIRRIDSDINNPIGAIDGGARRKGYNELIWDGRDRRGNEVANGVYFAILRARYEDQVIERTIKVAKLR